MNNTIISILSGLGGMFGWGTSDFFASQSSQKTGHFRTFLWSQIAGIILIFAVFLFVLPSISISPFVFLMILIAGIGYALGYLLFYTGFEIGNVSVISAVVNTQNVFVILIGIFLFKEVVSFRQIAGILGVLIGAVLVSINIDDFKNKKISFAKGVKETLMSAFLFGVIFWPFNKYVGENSHWLTGSLLIKLVAIVTILVIAFVKKEKISISKISNKSKLVIGLVGILEALAVLSISFGSTIGSIAIVGPISACLTAITVSLSVVFLKEKISKLQIVAILMIILGVVVTAI